MPVLLHLLAVAVFAQGTSEFVLAGLLPGIAADLGVSVGRAGTLTSAFAAGMVLGAPVMAVAARRLAPRWVLSTFLLLFIAAHVAGAVTEDFTALLASRVAAAFANAGFLAGALSTVIRLVPEACQARGIAVILSGTTLALVAGVPAGALVGDLLGWRATLWAIAAICVPALLAVALAAPSGRTTRGNRDDVSSLRSEVATLRSRPVRRNLALAVLVNAATFCSFTYLVVIATGPVGLPERLTPAVLAVFGVGAFVGVNAAGRLGDRHWRRVIALGAPVLAAGWAAFALTLPSTVALWCLALTQGFASFLVGSTVLGRIVATARAAPTLAGAFATAALNVGATVGPAAGGVAIDVAGGPGPLALSATLAGAAALAWWSPRPRGLRRAERATG